MVNLVKLILKQQLSEAKERISKKLDDIQEKELVEYKKFVNSKIGFEIKKSSSIEDFYQGGNLDRKTEIEILPEGIDLDEARFKIVRVRIRKGKIQRRKKVATQKGFTFRGGKLTRMLPKEKRNRRIAQRRGALKRRGKINRAKRKTKRSMRRRKALGV